MDGDARDLTRAIPAIVRQTTVLSEVQLVVRHTVCIIVAVGVRSSCTKFMPMSDIGADPVSGAFADHNAVILGPSKENIPVCVPTTPATVNDSATAVFPPTGVAQTTVVVPIHWVAVQAVEPIRADAEKSSAPKFVPNMVKLVPPLVGPLLPVVVITGALYVKTSASVASSPKRATPECSVEPAPPASEHESDVEDIHAVVAQRVLPTRAVGVRFI
jgi:hypothetical protein